MHKIYSTNKNQIRNFQLITLIMYLTGTASLDKVIPSDNMDITNRRATTIKSSSSSTFSTLLTYAPTTENRSMLQETLPAWRLSPMISVSFPVVFNVAHLAFLRLLLFIASVFVFPMEVNARSSKDDMIYSIRIVIDDHEVQHFAFRFEAAVAGLLVFAAVP